MPDTQQDPERWTGPSEDRFLSQTLRHPQEHGSWAGATGGQTYGMQTRLSPKPLGQGHGPRETRGMAVGCGGPGRLGLHYGLERSLSSGRGGPHTAPHSLHSGSPVLPTPWENLRSGPGWARATPAGFPAAPTWGHVLLCFPGPSSKTGPWPSCVPRAWPGRIEGLGFRETLPRSCLPGLVEPLGMTVPEASAAAGSSGEWKDSLPHSCPASLRTGCASLHRLSRASVGREGTVSNKVFMFKEAQV